MLHKNVDLSTSTISDMPGVDTKVICHFLTLKASIKLVTYKNHKVCEEKRLAIDKEVRNLKEFVIITKIKYTTWLKNMVLVKKALCE